MADKAPMSLADARAAARAQTNKVGVHAPLDVAKEMQKVYRDPEFQAALAELRALLDYLPPEDPAFAFGANTVTVALGNAQMLDNHIKALEVAEAAKTA